MADASPALQPQIYAVARVAGGDFKLTDVELRHGIDEPGEASAVYYFEGDFDPDFWINRIAELRFGHDTTSVEGRFAGMITHAEHAHLGGARFRATLTVKPRIVRLHEHRRLRIFRRLDLAGLIRSLLGDHGLGPEDWRLALAESYPARDWVLQADETDGAFLFRQLSLHGVFTFTEVVDGRDVIVFADHNAAGGASRAGLVSYHADAGMVAAPETAHQLRPRARTQAPAASWHHREDPPRERPQARPLDRPARVHHAPPQASAAAARHGAERLDRAERARARSLRLVGSVADAPPGASLAVDAARHRVAKSGDYLITRAHIRVTAGDSHAGAEPGAVNADLELASLSVPWAPAPVELPELPPVLATRIEADTAEALLEPDGRYRARVREDLNDHPYTQASPGLPAITSYTTRNDEALPPGRHFPLRDGSEVLITCLDNDPDRPCLIGFAPSADQPGPVTGNNPADNTLLTPGGNRFTASDLRGREKVILETFQGHTIAELNARTNEAFVRLACAHGAWLAYAGQDMLQMSEGDAFERVGGSRSEQVTRHHAREAATGSLHQQAATDVELIADNNINIAADEHIHVQTGQSLELDVEDSTSVTIEGADGMRLRLSQGRLEVDVARSIEITGQGGGDIVFEQADGGIAIKPDGSVRLFGNEVTLAATNGNVQFNGPVNYRVPEGNQATPASEVTPEVAQTPDDLPDPDARSLVEVGAHKPLLALTDPDGEPLERLSAWFSTRGYDREKGPVTLTLRRETSATSAELGTGTRSPDEPDGAWDGELAPVGQPQPGASMRPADEDKPDRFILQARLQSETREESS